MSNGTGRPIKDWYAELPPVIRAAALRNYADPACWHRMRDEPAYDLAAAVYGGFLWEYTPEGAAYWVDLYHWAFEGENGPIPLPPSTLEVMND